MTIHLSLVLHNHQPVGNFGWVFEEAFQKAYLPFVALLERHPAARAALHYTGPLRDWLLTEQPSFIPRVRELVEQGQVEIIGGAYYEPVLVALPDADKRGQIEKLSAAIEGDFGVRPRGMWLAERVWEPHLVKPIAESGIEYVILDDDHFKAVGYDEADLFGYYVSEEQGHTLRVFGGSKTLRYTIPYAPVDDIISWLREQAASENGRYIGHDMLALMGDDGEKFGLWPGSYQRVWQEGWLDDFFAAAAQNAEWLHITTPSDFARDHRALGRIYLPSTSYYEMGEWSLPSKGAYALPALRTEFDDRPGLTRYLRGGLWRQFMVKYAEVNQLHKKALRVSQKVHAMPPGRDKDHALDHLWAGQCNCAYWHGVFGGIYLFHIRQADYAHLIAAESLADGEIPFSRVAVDDFDRDGDPEAVVDTERQTLVIDANEGAALVEWDFRPAHYNLLNVLTRREEGYHQRLRDADDAGLLLGPGVEDPPEGALLAKEPDLLSRLQVDWYRRASFLDHFFDHGPTLDDFYRSRLWEKGDFVDQPFTIAVEGGTGVILSRDGHVWQGEWSLPMRVEKRLTVEGDQLTATYTLTNQGEITLTQRFGIELNWGIAGGQDLQHAALVMADDHHCLGERAESHGVEWFTVTTSLWGFAVDVTLSRAASLWRFPLETVSASEDGYERNYQGTTMLLWWPLHLDTNWKIELTFNLRLV